MDTHSFTTLKEDQRKKAAVTEVTLYGHLFKVQVNGRVYGWHKTHRRHTLEISYYSPLAVEARKASGWFK